MSDSTNNTNTGEMDGVSPSEFTGPGSAYQVIKQYNKTQCDASGYEPVIITLTEVEKKKKISLI